MPPEILSKALAQRDSALESFLFVPSASLSANRLKDISGALAAGAGVEQLGESDVEPVLVDSLLESEARVTAWLQVSRLKMSDEQWEIAEQNRTLFNPLYMSSKYVNTFYTFYSALRPVGGGETSTFVKLMLSIFPFFVDLALIDYHFDTGQFICPFAEANVCHAALADCRTGLTKPTQFPQTSDCLVRHSLEGTVFKLN